MLKSMTGYGRAIATIEGMEITVEIKAVNHRYFDFSARVPRTYGFLEEKLKSYIQENVSRGKVEAFVGIQTMETPNVRVEINRPLLESYLAAFSVMEAEYGIKQNFGTADALRMPDLFAIAKTEEDLEALWARVKEVANEALQSFISMRETEGAKMREDVLQRAAFLEEQTFIIEQISQNTVSDYQTRLENRIRTILDDRQIEENRLLTEVALFADKIAVAEETVRLRSHLAQLRDFLNAKEAIGRKIDFLVQEMNREVNTIGSKAGNIEIARIVVDLKSEIEKIREQIQNIE